MKSSSDLMYIDELLAWQVSEANHMMPSNWNTRSSGTYEGIRRKYHNTSYTPVAIIEWQSHVKRLIQKTEKS
jgi:hypothetical protein